MTEFVEIGIETGIETGIPILNSIEIGISEVSKIHFDNVHGSTFIMGGSRGINGKENQDSYSTIKISHNGITYTIVIVVDGHGVYGSTFSQYTVSEFMNNILENFSDIIKNPLALKSIFINFNAKLYENFSQLSSGGTTGTIIIVSMGQIITANVGDCDVFAHVQTEFSNIQMIQDEQVCLLEKNIFVLTGNHDTTSDIESIRVLKTGSSVKYAQISGRLGNDVFTHVSESDKYTRVPFANQKNAYVINMNGDGAIYFVDPYDSRLNISRSFGDFKTKFVIVEPTVTVVTFPTDIKTKIIMGSDGYFNCFRTEEIYTQFSFNSEDIISNGLTKAKEIFGNDSDNMTIVVVDNC